MNSKYTPTYKTIEGVLEPHTFSVPVYQRPYSWGEEQVNTLLSDIHSAFLEKGQLFIGTTYLKRATSNENHYELIDGQQRFITFSLFLLTLYAVMKEYNINDTETELNNIKNILWKRIERKNKRESLLISSSSIEGAMIESLFNAAFDSADTFRDYVNNYTHTNHIEKNIIDILEIMFKFIDLNYKGKEIILDISDFVLININLIMIVTHVSNSQIFNMFEAINSKGKKLDDIDLIKTYIFSKLAEEDYDNYLTKWGKLIADTNDKLEDYLWVYVKAFIKYYVYSIKVHYFKSMLTDQKTISYFDSDDEPTIIKKLIDDLISKVKYYKAISDYDSFRKITKKKAHVLQYNIFKNLKYEHPKPIILRALYEYDTSNKNDVASNKLQDVIRYLNSFMLIYQTMNNRDSKDSIPVIKLIAENSYDLNSIEPSTMKQIISSKLLSENMDLDSFKQRFYELDAYKGNATDIGVFMLIIFNSIDSETKFFSEDMANSLFEIRSNLSADHILPQKPDKNSLFKYFYDQTVLGDEILRLKEGSDFPDTIISGMLYSDFKSRVLHKIGNIRLAFKDGNSSRGNTEIKLEDNNNFLTYNQVKTRASNILNDILKTGVIFIPDKSDVVIDTSEQEDRFILDFNNLSEATGKKAVLIKINEEHYQVKSTVDIVKIVLSYLYSKDSEKILMLADGKTSGFGNKQYPVISSNPSRLREPERIPKTDVYFEKNNDNQTRLTLLKDLIQDAYNLDINDIQIIYKV